MSKKIKKILVKYFVKEASLTDLDELSCWIENPKNKEEFIKYIKITHAVDFNMKKFGTEDSKKKLFKFIVQEKKARTFRTVSNVMKYAAVLVLLLGLFYITNFFNSEHSQIDIETTNALVIEDGIEAGSDKATLTLEDGTKIDLEKGKTVQTARAKSTGKKLVYDAVKKSATKTVYNYLTIPRGGQFQLKLSDGTMVWLNSDSQLKYPVEFIDGETRKVELLYGEAYFEVSPSTAHEGSKFKIINRFQEIEVIGTQFNVRAYKEEKNIYTTLVEGKVAISSMGIKTMLIPGQQANLNITNNAVVVSPVDVKSEIAWVKGVFSFKGKTLREIAKVLERWYDIDIVFTEPKLLKIKFNGVLHKTETIEAIMESILITNSIHAYDIDEKTISIQ